MITSNRITILMPDNAVYLDQGVYQSLDLTTCGVPDYVRALDWMNGSGEIHNYDSSVPHEQVSVLPDWAVKCIEKWEERNNLETNQ